MSIKTKRRITNSVATSQRILRENRKCGKAYEERERKKKEYTAPPCLYEPPRSARRDTGARYTPDETPRTAVFFGEKIPPPYHSGKVLPLSRSKVLPCSGICGLFMSDLWQFGRGIIFPDNAKSRRMEAIGVFSRCIRFCSYIRKSAPSAVAYKSVYPVPNL